MSFETVVLISGIAEIIVLSAISLTLINAFSHGALGRLVSGQKKQTTNTQDEPNHKNASEYRRAA